MAAKRDREEKRAAREERRKQKKSLPFNLRLLAEELPHIKMKSSSSPNTTSIPETVLTPDALRVMAHEVDLFRRVRDSTKPEAEIDLSGSLAENCLREAVRSSTDFVFQAVKKLRRNEDETQTELLAFEVAQALIPMKCALRALHSGMLALRALSDKRDFLVIMATLDKWDAEHAKMREIQAESVLRRQRKQERHFLNRMNGLPEPEPRAARKGGLGGSKGEGKGKGKRAKAKRRRYDTDDDSE